MCVCVHSVITITLLGKFKEGMKNNNKIPRTVDQFEQVTEASTESALKVRHITVYSK